MKRLLGWIVLVGMLLFAASYVSGHWPHGGRFGCDSAGVAVAHAASGHCPPDISAAAGDAAWAAARIAAIDGGVAGNAKKYTYGEFYDPDGTEYSFVSGQNGDADNARDVGRSAGLFPA